MGHYAMIPMNEYEEFMKWKKEKRNLDISIWRKPSTYTSNHDDIPF